MKDGDCPHVVLEQLVQRRAINHQVHGLPRLALLLARPLVVLASTTRAFLLPLAIDACCRSIFEMLVWICCSALIVLVCFGE